MDGRQLLGWASKQIPDLKGVRSATRRRRGCGRRSSNGPRSRWRRPTGSPAAGCNLRPDDRALPADAPGRGVRAIGLGLVREATPQPMDRRSTAKVRGDLVRGSDRGGANQERPIVNATRPARFVRPGRLLWHSKKARMATAE